MDRFTDTLVIGGGQAGLSIGHYLSRRGLDFVILDAEARVGDRWRHRWDSLSLFTPALIDGLPGERYPGPSWSFPSHTDFADYLETYATRHRLPIRSETRVKHLTREADTFIAECAASTYRARSVVVATGEDQTPRLPPFAAEVSPDTPQFTAASYQNPQQVPAGNVLIVGAGNSGAEIAMDLAATHRVLLSGRHPGQLPFPAGRGIGKPLGRVAFWAFGHVLTVDSPIGRKVRPTILAHSGPLIRVRSRDLAAAGVRRVGRTVGVRAGRPVVDGADLPPISAIIWCTGFRPDDAWIELPIFDESGRVRQRGGASLDIPGLYVLGRLFQQSLASSMIHGAANDAKRVADRVARSLITQPFDSASRPHRS